MPTPARIHDLLARADHERLFRELVSAETPLPLSARLILNNDAGVAPVVEAFALARVVDAGYRPSRQAIVLASRVVDAARTAIEAPVWEEASDHAWALRAVSLVALEAWRARLDLLHKLGVTPDLPSSLDEIDALSARLTDALASWLHAQLAIDAPLEATPLRVTLLWLLAERAPGALRPSLDRLRERLDEAGAAHHPALAELFVRAGRRQERARLHAPALSFQAA